MCHKQKATPFSSLIGVVRWLNNPCYKIPHGKIQSNIKLGGNSSLRERTQKNSPGHTQLILTTSRNVSVYSTLFSLILFTAAQQCHLYDNKAQSSRSPGQITPASGKDAKLDKQRHVLMKRQIFLNANFAGCVSHSPRASDMRGPVPDPLPPLGHNTRCSSAVCASAALFLFGIVSSPPRLVPLSRASQ